MGTISRISDIINSNIQAVLDRAEEPERVVRLMIAQIQEALADVRSKAAHTIADRKELDRRLRHLDGLTESWQKKAEQALTKGREDLARSALLQKVKLRDAMKDAFDLLAEAKETVDQYDVQISKLKKKLGEARAKYKSMYAKKRPAKPAAAAPRRDERIFGKRMEAAFDRLENIERKLDSTEGVIESYELGGESTLESELADLEVDDDILAELNALKKSRDKGAGANSNKT